MPIIIIHSSCPLLMVGRKHYLGPLMSSPDPKASIFNYSVFWHFCNISDNCPHYSLIHLIIFYSLIYQFFSSLLIWFFFGTLCTHNSALNMHCFPVHTAGCDIHSEASHHIFMHVGNFTQLFAHLFSASPCRKKPHTQWDIHWDKQMQESPQYAGPSITPTTMMVFHKFYV